jgi:3-hydroxyacyl-[acyl-carrier-protein] dehydratase
MQDVKSLIPHRKPFLFVDRIEEADETRIIGYKKFGPDEFFFKGHFPEYPVVPGVILVESMAQCGGAGVSMSGLLKDALFFLATVDKVKLRNQVRPGDEVKMVVQNIRVSKIAIKQSGKAYVNDTLCAEAEWLCMIGQKKNLPA